MIKKHASLLILILLFSHLSLAHEEFDVFDVKELRDTGKISSLEIILDKLSNYNISRLLEAELKWENNQYIYKLEYINHKNVVLEIEVDAITAQVLEIEHEH